MNTIKANIWNLTVCIVVNEKNFKNFRSGDLDLDWTMPQ